MFFIVNCVELLIKMERKMVKLITLSKSIH